MVKRILVLALALALLAAVFLYIRNTERAEQMQMQQMYQKIEPLQAEQQSLKWELEKLDTEYENRSRDFSTLQIMFREMPEKLYSEVYPLMRDRGIRGVFCLSMDKYPGTGINISAVQYQRMINDGWGICYYYDSELELDYWLTNLESWLERDGLGIPTSIYFPQGYSSAVDEILANHGITIVVENVDEVSCEEVKESGPLWISGAMIWNYTGVIGDLEKLAQADGGNLVLRVSFTESDDGYQRLSFINCLNELQGLSVEQKQENEENASISDGLMLLNLDAARDWHRHVNDDLQEQEEEYNARRAEIEERLEEIAEEISSIYAQWKSE